MNYKYHGKTKFYLLKMFFVDSICEPSSLVLFICFLQLFEEVALADFQTVHRSRQTSW